MRNVSAIARGMLCAAAAGCGPQPGTAPPSEESPLPAAEHTVQQTVPEDVLDRTSRDVRRGEPLDLVLRRLGLDDAERHVAVQALAEHVDLRRILPGERVEVARGAGGRLGEVALQRSVRLRVVARFPEGGPARCETVEPEAEIRVISLQGTVDGSLYESLLTGGADANLVMRFAELLAWQVDFLTEPRRGDRFRILVEKERIDGAELGFGKILAAEYAGDRASARAIRYVDLAGNLDWYDDDGQSVRRAFLKSPLDYRRISSGFTARRRHPVLKRVMPHWGVDYAAASGTPVSALGKGVVEFAGRRGGFGNYIEIRHGQTYTTCYGHLRGFAKGIRRGARVEQGQVIGYVGSTGLSTGPHLDFRVKKRGQWVNPLRFESPPGRHVARAEGERFRERRDRLWRLAGRIEPGEEVPAEKAWALVPPGETHSALLALVP